MSKETLEIAGKFQNNCHAFTKIVIAEKPKVSVQDATNVWLFEKLAEFEMRLQRLEKQNNPIG